MRVYLAGPMSGYPDDNFPAFNEAARVLRQWGVEVVNPTEFGEEAAGVKNPGAALRASYLKLDVLEMMSCDAIALLPGWYDSIGANIELVTALATGLVPYLYDEFEMLVKVVPPVNWQLVTMHVGDMQRGLVNRG